MNNKKAEFFGSLTDKQTGFYYAFEHDADLEDRLQDELTAKQFMLYKEWKDSEDEESTEVITECEPEPSSLTCQTVNFTQTENQDVANTSKVSSTAVESDMNILMNMVQKMGAAMETIVKRLDTMESRLDLICSKVLPHSTNAAKRWCAELLKEIESRASSEIGTRETIKTIHQIMKKFSSNEEIEANCCTILRKISCKDKI